MKGPARRLLADVRPLRESPAFRRFWIGTAVSSIGGTMTGFAVMLQTYNLTHSSAAVGANAAALPNLGGYAPMHLEGAIVLGTGGDNSKSSADSFFEGVMTAGCPTDAADNAVQASIVSVGYRT
jgi:hypothetical protein